jgi:hypothetical protein
MTMPRVKVEAVQEDGRDRFYLRHNLRLSEVPFHPAGGPYASEAEANAAADRLVAVWADTSSD